MGKRGYTGPRLLLSQLLIANYLYEDICFVEGLEQNMHIPLMINTTIRWLRSLILVGRDEEDERLFSIELGDQIGMHQELQELTEHLKVLTSYNFMATKQI